MATLTSARSRFPPPIAFSSCVEFPRGRHYGGPLRRNPACGRSKDPPTSRALGPSYTRGSTATLSSSPGCPKELGVAFVLGVLYWRASSGQRHSYLKRYGEARPSANSNTNRGSCCIYRPGSCNRVLLIREPLTWDPRAALTTDRGFRVSSLSNMGKRVTLREAGSVEEHGMTRAPS